MKSVGIPEGPTRYICYEHVFETNDANRFEDHQVKEKHIIPSGNDPCVYCQEPTHFENLRYRGKNKRVGAVCHECATENEVKGNAKRVTLEDTNNLDTLSEDSKKKVLAFRAQQAGGNKPVEKPVHTTGGQK